MKIYPNSLNQHNKQWCNYNNQIKYCRVFPETNNLQRRKYITIQLSVTQLNIISPCSKLTYKRIFTKTWNIVEALPSELQTEFFTSRVIGLVWSPERVVACNPLSVRQPRPDLVPVFVAASQPDEGSLVVVYFLDCVKLLLTPDFGQVSSEFPAF